MVKQTVVESRPINIQSFRLKLVGTSPLICHAWNQKATQMILNKQKKKAKQGDEIRRPIVEFADSLHWLSEKPNLDGLSDEEARDVLADVIPKSTFGFPSSAFKSAALNAGFQQGALVSKAGTKDLGKTTARGGFFIQGEFAVIDGTPTPREDRGRNPNGGSAVIMYRAEFRQWSVELFIKYNASSISIEQIINLLNLAGFSNGIGEWRPEKNGPFGTFKVETHQLLEDLP